MNEPVVGTTDNLPLCQGQRHTLAAESELRLEVSHRRSCEIVLQQGSCELWGVELARNVTYSFPPQSKLALLTWHGCVLDVNDDEDDGNVFSYTSDETDANVAYVNTHAQLEALRDDALQTKSEGPRVIVVGPTESGKSSLSRTLVAYATKVGRTPLWVDLDPADNALSVPGTLAVAPMTASSLSVDTTLPKDTQTLAFWYGKSSLDATHKDLWQAQVSAMAQRIDQRLHQDSEAARASGIIVNTNGWIQEEGYHMLLHAMEELRITVVLILGHDRLYSMLKSHFQNKSQSCAKIIKLPRSGGVVSRDAAFLRNVRSNAVKRYFYGEAQPSLTPFLAHVPFAQVSIYKWSSVTLSASLLPVSSKQATEPVQLVPTEISEKLQHSILAVCHPVSVQAYKESGSARDLYETGVAGFVSVERVLVETEMLHLLSPCAGALPSYVLILGDVTWME